VRAVAGDRLHVHGRVVGTPDQRLEIIEVRGRDGAVLVTGSAVAERSLESDGLEPAAAASIVEFDERTVRFRHPLMRSAVSQAASVAQRQRVHEALTQTLRADPDRRVWHRAALLTGEHEDIALELEEAGRRARRRGAISVAVAAMRRAAELSEFGHPGRRLLAAAELAFELGQRDVVASLHGDADELGLGSLDRARATWIQEMVETRPLGDRRFGR